MRKRWIVVALLGLVLATAACAARAPQAVSEPAAMSSEALEQPAPAEPPAAMAPSSEQAVAQGVTSRGVVLVIWLLRRAWKRSRSREGTAAT